jgi:cell wall-associated NlpC family hydrolase
LVLAVLVISTADVPLAHADPIADKRAEAERINRQLEQQGRQVSILAEQYDAAQVKIAKLQDELDAAQAQVQQTDTQADEIRGRLKDRAVDAYVRGGNAPAIALLAQTRTTDDVAVRTQYVQTVTSGATDVLDELRVVRQELELQQSHLDEAKAEARAAAAVASAKRKEASAAVAAQQATLNQVQGELAALVEAEAKRRAEEEARRVQAELAAKKAKAAAQAAAEAAARDAAARRTTTTAPNGKASPSGTVRPPTTTTTTKPSSTAGSSPSSGSGAPAAGADAAVAEARRQLGKPYEYGAAGPDSFDCSGLTSWSWRAGGKQLSHSSQAQWSETSRVAIDNLQPGDLLFYGSPIHHVGIYIGDGQMIEAPETGKTVRITTIYRSDLVGAGRVN